VCATTTEGCPISRVFCEKWGFSPAPTTTTLPVPTSTRMPTTPARRMPTAATRRAVGSAAIARCAISTRRPRLHHRLPHVQLRTRRSSPITVRVAAALRSGVARRAPAPVAATLTAAPSPSFTRLTVRRRRERTEPAAIPTLRRTRAARRFRAGFRRTRSLAARTSVGLAAHLPPTRISAIGARARARPCRRPSAASLAETRPAHPTSGLHRRHMILLHRLPQLCRLLVERFRPRRALRPVETLRSAVNA